MARGLQSCRIGLARADAHGVIETKDENLAVADLAGLGRRADGLDNLVDLVGIDGHFNLELWQEAHRIFSASVDFRVALLAPISLDFGDGHPVHPDAGQSVADLVELEGLDDGHDDFHGVWSLL